MNATSPTITTDEELRSRAAEICEAFDSREQILSRVAVFDAETSAKLAALDNEISDLDRRADGENTVAIQMLVIKREQRTRLAAKLAAERELLLSETNREAWQAVQHLDLMKLFADALTFERQRAISALGTLMENEARAVSMSGQMDAIISASFWATNLCRTLPGSAVAARLRAFVNGTKSIWRI